MGVDFALFWAVMIGLMNYIPYVGSLVGVAFPVVLSLAQFGSIPTTLILCGLLTAAQTFVGNVLEPRWIGRQLNLSPVVVLLALSFWAALWGIPGAILAVPMTSMITIVCGAFPASRFVAVLLSEKVDENAVAQDETKV
jgi:predicted PurR-regulated permease PerM